jgi:hypothetical protein
MTREELLKLRPDFAEHIAKRPQLKPRRPPPTAVVPLEGKVGEIAKANPRGVEVRVTARDADGTTYVEPPKRPKEIVQPLEVDGDGRVSRARIVDCSTGEAGIVEYRDGYCVSGVVSDWNPMDGLRRSGDE